MIYGPSRKADHYEYRRPVKTCENNATIICYEMSHIKKPLVNSLCYSQFCLTSDDTPM